VAREGARSPSGLPAAGVDHVLVRYEDTPRWLAALEHARALADARGALLMVVAVAPHEASQCGCAICRSTAGLYDRQMDEIAEEEIAAAATHVGFVTWSSSLSPRAAASGARSASSRCREERKR
jgi:hypothetical protein